MFVGITQRVEQTSYGEIRDCLDLAWTELIQLFGHVPLPLCTKVTCVDYYLSKLPLNAVILSGGNDLSRLPNGQNIFPIRDQFEKETIQYCLNKKIPLLGVCRGMQVINDYFLGTLCSVSGHAGTSHQINIQGKSEIVNSYHNWGILQSELADPLTPLAMDSDEMVEAFTSENVIGIMWHPERETELSDVSRNILTQFFQRAL